MPYLPSKKCYYLIFTFIFFHAIAYGQSLTQKIDHAFRLLEQDQQVAHGIVSLTVLNARTGEVVFAKNEEIGLATASTLKTITSAAAYYLLGPDYRYQTDVRYSGKILPDNVLDGDIIIKGSGDPSLGSNRFEETKEEELLKLWVAKIKQAGIRKIKGGIIGDDLLFGGQTAGPRWIWQDMGSYYGAGPSGLNWRENLADIHLRAGNRVGAPTTLIGTHPDLTYLKIINETTTGAPGSGDEVYPLSAPYSGLVYLRGTYGIDLHKTIQMSLPDAAYDAALRLQLALEKEGISVGQAASTATTLSRTGVKRPFTGTVIASHLSPALSDIIYWFNQKSINLYGEALLKTMALVKGEKTETDEAAALLQGFWSDKLGLPKGTLRIFDGSGLSPETRVTTLSMAKILASVKEEPWFDAYFRSFPTYNGMKMKSGTIAGVLGYAGYQRASNGTDLVFSLLVNNYEGSANQMRQKMFKLLNTLK